MRLWKRVNIRAALVPIGEAWVLNRSGDGGREPCCRPIHLGPINSQRLPNSTHKTGSVGVDLMRSGRQNMIKIIRGSDFK